MSTESANKKRRKVNYKHKKLGIDNRFSFQKPSRPSLKTLPDGPDPGSTAHTIHVESTKHSKGFLRSPGLDSVAMWDADGEHRPSISNDSNGSNRNGKDPTTGTTNHRRQPGRVVKAVPSIEDSFQCPSGQASLHRNNSRMSRSAHTSRIFSNGRNSSSSRSTSLRQNGLESLPKSFQSPELASSPIELEPHKSSWKARPRSPRGARETLKHWYKFTSKQPHGMSLIQMFKNFLRDEDLVPAYLTERNEHEDGVRLEEYLINMIGQQRDGRACTEPPIKNFGQHKVNVANLGFPGDRTPHSEDSERMSSRMNNQATSEIPPRTTAQEQTCLRSFPSVIQKGSDTAASQLSRSEEIPGMQTASHVHHQKDNHEQSSVSSTESPALGNQLDKRSNDEKPVRPLPALGLDNLEQPTTNSLAITPQVERRLSRSNDFRSRSSKKIKHRNGSSSRAIGHTATLPAAEASQCTGKSIDIIKADCTLPGPSSGTFSANTGTKRAAEEDTEVLIRNEVEKDGRRIMQGQNRINKLYHGRSQRQSNIEVRVPKHTKLTIPSNGTTNARRSEAQVDSAGDAQPLASMLAAQPSKNTKTRGGFHHRPGHRATSMLQGRVVPMQVQCECIGLPPYFTSTNTLPNLKSWKGQRSEFFDHVASIQGCPGHPQALRDHCRRLLPGEIGRARSQSVFSYEADGVVFQEPLMSGALLSPSPTSPLRQSKHFSDPVNEQFDESTYFRSLEPDDTDAKDDATYIHRSSSEEIDGSTQSPSPSPEPTKKSPSHRPSDGTVLSRPRAKGEASSSSSSRTPLQTLSVNIPDLRRDHSSRSRSANADERNKVLNHPEFARLIKEAVREEIAAHSAGVHATNRSTQPEWDEIIDIARRNIKSPCQRFAAAKKVFTSHGGRFRQFYWDHQFLAYIRTKNIFSEDELGRLFPPSFIHS